MSIKTKSLFFYGHIVENNNFAVDFKEGATTYEADFPVGDYSLSEFVTALEALLNNVGTLDYTVSVNRTTRLITISAPTDFELLVSSGRGATLYPLIGFTGADRTGTNSYIGDTAAGSEWRPQNVAMEYVPKELNEESISPVINETTIGEIETLTYGDRSFIEANFTLINNHVQGAGSILDEDLSATVNAVNFLKHARKKFKFEFMPDRDTPTTFSVVLLESIPGHSTGTGFKLARMFNEGNKNHYETGVMEMRVVT